MPSGQEKLAIPSLRRFRPQSELGPAKPEEKENHPGIRKFASGCCMNARLKNTLVGGKFFVLSNSKKQGAVPEGRAPIDLLRSKFFSLDLLLPRVFLLLECPLVPDFQKETTFAHLEDEERIIPKKRIFDRAIGKRVDVQLTFW